MSLQFVMGPSGAGKSHYLYQKVTEESRKHPEKNYIVLVPEQFTMQTQRDLCMANPRGGILNVDVLSFNRLAYRVFEEVGGNDSIVLDDVGKSFVLRKIAADYESELKVLGSNLKKPGFIREMQSVISEFTQYDVQEDKLEELADGLQGETNFYYKLKDIQTIYRGFQAYLKGKYSTAEELLVLLCDVISQSSILKDSVIVLDGFTGFTPVQLKLLRELFFVCEKVLVAVTTGREKRRIPLFEMSNKMIDSLAWIAKETRTEIEDSVELFRVPVYRFRENEALGFLESHLFRYTRQVYEKDQENLQIWNAKNPKEEMDFVAQSIRKMVREEGYRYREFAVIASDMTVYANHAKKAFQSYDIPVFMDHKRSILLNSFVEYLRSLLAMGEQNFTYESVFRYLRTDLTEFTREEIDILENYCVALGIRGYKKWQTKWIRRMRDMEEEDLARVNDIRERFAANIEGVMEQLKSRTKTVESITRALHNYLYDNDLQRKVKAYEERFAKEGEAALEKEYAQVYRIVMEIFDKFVELLGDERISLKEYCELLDAGLETAKVGIIPPGLDQVVVGDIERTRIKDVKVIFFVGLNDAYIPGKAGGGGLLSERDREKFAESNILLAPTAKEKMFIQKFYLYWILTKPSERLVLTFSSASSEGTSLRQAYLISDILRMYPKLSIKRVQEGISERELTPEMGMSILAKELPGRSSGLSMEWQELYSWYKRHPEWAKSIQQMVEAAFYQKKEESLSRQTAENLYGEVLQNSVSRLEKYVACAYAHFLTYGLKLKEREVFQFQAVDLGNLFHGAMERFSTKLVRAGYTWTQLPEEKRDEFITESVSESVVDYGNTILYSTARNEYMITRLTRMMKRTVWALTKQLERGDFQPTGYELVYDSGAFPLDGGHAMKIYGKIDRVDTYETKDHVYVKVIDYKTGTKAFDLGEFYHGLQMQLVVYMNAAMEKEAREHPDKQIVPAGLFYYQMKDPVIERQADDFAREQEILKALRPDGIVNQDEEILRHLDAEFEGQSPVIPVARNKNGSLSKTSKVLPEEDFKVLSSYAKVKMEAIGKEILSGKIDAAPYTEGEKNACSYCPYGGVCGFDEGIAGHEYRKLEKLGKEQAIEKMREEV